MFFLSHCCQSLSLAGSHSPPHLPRMPSNTVLISGPALGAAWILIWSYSVCSCLQCPQVSQLVHFLLWELSMSFYTFHRQTVCLVNHVDLICSLYSWWEGFGSSLATLPLGFNCGFISTSTCGSSSRVYSWGCPGGLGFAPVRVMFKVGQLLGSQGFWQHQVLRGVGG